MRNFYLTLCLLCFISTVEAQTFKYMVSVTNHDDVWFVKTRSGSLTYEGSNARLKTFFSNYHVSVFEQSFPTSERENLLKVFTVETSDMNLMTDMVRLFPSEFYGPEDHTNEVIELESAYYPNDYGSTTPGGGSSTINRHDLDYIKAPKAWGIATGDGVTVGLSDARIKADDPDFVGKLSFINPCSCQTSTYNPAIPAGLQTQHGTGVGGAMAARGDNNYASAGVCYDCEIIATGYLGGLSNVLLVAQAGAKVINMSWAALGYSAYNQSLVNSIVEDYGTVLVAGAGNTPSHSTATEYLCEDASFNAVTSTYYNPTPGMLYYYPASYDNVISVSGIGHFYAANDPAAYINTSPTGIAIAGLVEDSFSPNVSINDPLNPVGLLFNGWAQYCESPVQLTSPSGIVNTYTYNEKVDILAPGYNTFHFSKFAEEGGIINYLLFAGTSGATPLVSGAVALMISANDCLSPAELETVMKLTTKDVENMPINQNFRGYIGAGALDAGDAVEFADEMKKANGLAVVDNHIFDRWNFSLQRINNKLKIDKVVFKQANVSNFTARTNIEVTSSDFNPTTGSVDLKIDTALDLCPAPTAKNGVARKSEQPNEVVKSKLYPNPTSGKFTVESTISSAKQHFDIFDVVGKKIHEGDFENGRVEIDLPQLPRGAYFLTLTSGEYRETLKFIKQ